ncbi:MAG: 4-hydroxyphenylacetate 3-hydroxylase N-terminal domain-containing protein [Vicinamibacterales bacterium]|jgi:aromatic ring hydroxylase|nr:4-hydroxyphenylacetate 3-hydroxylase [Acidobacteriota bacterium]MDP6372780.1 4-hydroxyphenylacetate 3-hydroxylase N-terminal domain-containing protein [Vicinamibacterales bacterium]MDP6608870.1 4-hydroxyphenylacetate 3-hydroxylase N-terminal domain-containing protein [Vicinamibacterales bacterium]|tara:strand:- start:1291 stop:2799 length:1509 start_codon:yes stop_codon:yes gene_type:complete
MTDAPDTTGTARAIAPMAAAEGKGALDGKRYLESLRDDREVWYRGERIADVTTHPVFAEMAAQIGRIYDMQHAPETRDVMTYEQENGLRASYSYLPASKPEHLLLRRGNTEVWVREVFGMCGRLPDFCASMVIGYYDIRGELAKLNPDLARNTETYLAYARDNDLCLSHGLHDPCMDKSLRPSQDPDRCVRVVKERDDGIVVRGARFNTFGLFSNEILISPTYMFAEDEAEFALWFTVPCNAPGLKQITREAFSGRNPSDHPVSARFDEVDSLVVFDDVFIPWERVFLYREPLAANRLFRGNVMSWASYAGSVLTQLRMEILVAVAHLLATTSGVDKRPNVISVLGEMCTYLSLARTSLRAGEIDCQRTEGGHYRPAPAPERRALVTMVSERFVELVEHVGTSSLIFLPTAEDWTVPELKKHLDVYMRGKGTSPIDRYKLCKLAWDLTGDGFGSRQQLYERLHSGDPAVMVQNAYRQFDLSVGTELITTFLDLERPVTGAPK